MAKDMNPLEAIAGCSKIMEKLAYTALECSKGANKDTVIKIQSSALETLVKMAGELAEAVEHLETRARKMYGDREE